MHCFRPLFLSRGRHNLHIPQPISPTCAATISQAQDLVENGCGMNHELPGCTAKNIQPLMQMSQCNICRSKLKELSLETEYT